MPRKKPNLEEWKTWHDQIWQPCPVREWAEALEERARGPICRMDLCPCDLRKMDDWYQDQMTSWRKGGLFGGPVPGFVGFVIWLMKKFGREK